jgi:hypothetical protein
MVGQFASAKYWLTTSFHVSGDEFIPCRSNTTFCGEELGCGVFRAGSAKATFKLMASRVAEKPLIIANPI